VKAKSTLRLLFLIVVDLHLSPLTQRLIADASISNKYRHFRESGKPFALYTLKPTSIWFPLSRE